MRRAGHGSGQAVQRHGPPPPSQRFANILCTLGQIAFYLYMPYWLRPRSRRSGPFMAHTHTWSRRRTSATVSVQGGTEGRTGKVWGERIGPSGPRLDIVSGSGPSGIHTVLLRHTRMRLLITYQKSSVFKISWLFWPCAGSPGTAKRLSDSPRSARSFQLDTYPHFCTSLTHRHHIHLHYYFLNLRYFFFNLR